MKRVSTLLIAFLVSSSTFAENNYSEHYETYISKVSSCIQMEKNKEPLLSSTLEGVSKSSLITAIFYLKEKRIVDCSSREELDSLTRTLKENKGKIDYQLLEDRYLSIGLIKKEISFLDVTKDQREIIIDASRGKSLEVNLLDFFDEVESKI